MKRLVFALVAACLLAFSPALLLAQFNAADGFKVAWTLDPSADLDNFTHGPPYSARSAMSGMDFDGDGRLEILFCTDETLVPGGPDPGFLDIYLYHVRCCQILK